MTKYHYSVVSNSLFDIDASAPNAEIAIVGISPGSAQTKLYEHGRGPEKNNQKCAFAGSMRENLYLMLNSLSINKLLGIESCESLWDNGVFGKAVFTSLLPNPVVRTKEEVESIIKKWSRLEEMADKYQEDHNDNISGFYISQISYNAIKSNENLKQNYMRFFNRIKSTKKLRVIIALGTAYNVLIKAINEPIGDFAFDGSIKTIPIIRIPHASGANMEQINAFLYKSNNKTFMHKKPKNFSSIKVKKGEVLYVDAVKKLKSIMQKQ